MKITRIEVIPLVRKLEEEFKGGTYKIVNRNTIVTRVYTDSGIVGEAFGGDEDQRQDQVVNLIRDHFVPLLVGEDARDVERLWEKMFHSNIDLGNRSIHVLDLNNRGILMQAIAAVDNALWDALGKHWNVPLYKLLGGYRDKVPVIAIGGYYQAGKTQDALNEEMLHYKELQMAGVKFKVGRLSVKEDVERVARVRELVGDDFIIVCDANQAWTPDQAIQFCRAAAGLNIGWIEEPVQWSDQNEGLRLVRDNAPIPVTAGQGEISRWGCRDLVVQGRVNYLNVDVTIAGGVTEWRRIAAMASHFHVKMAHHEESQVALHLLASIPHGLYVEIFPNRKRDPMWFELPAQLPTIRNGYMELPSGPGLGMPLNEDIIARYRAS
ncbi:MAG: mandelate racemase/muconate lactonizing enzyme family protein [Anaerolineales bacterium]|nr:mandelate racemase/muconate lactonizing enzyme family protein [Anaerolineales bacterium]